MFPNPQPHNPEDQENLFNQTALQARSHSVLVSALSNGHLVNEKEKETVAQIGVNRHLAEVSQIMGQDAPQGMEALMVQINGRLTAIENRLTGIENRLTAIENRLTGIEERTDNIEQVFFNELGSQFKSVADDPDVRAIILTGGESKHFTAGLDLTDKALFEIISGGECTGRRGLKLRALIDRWQKAVTAIAQCQKPVIACVHGACIGGGVDLIAAADLRFCTEDAYFSVKEVDIGLAADLGSIQRLTKIIGHHGKLREWCYTGRNISSAEALQYGLVNGVYETKDAMMKQVQLLAEQIAAKSPIAIRGTKVSLEHALDHSVQEGLDFIKNWNMTMLQSEDLQKSVMSVLNKDINVKFSKL
ncbi:hypothetical protein MP228_007431 [Amoeboaphelidium protococcarum]|nr:hypothetical protein MP228_007431 [Amoeboaphelidium protococcarum]